MFGLRRKAAMTLDQLAHQMGWLGWATTAGRVINETTALDVAAVFCAARVIAEGIGQMPMRLVEESENSVTGLPRLRVKRDHWAHRLLAERPNDWQTPYEFREGMVFNAVLGRGAIAIKNVVRGEVRELLPVPAHSWKVEQRADWSLRFRVDYSDKTHGYFEREQVFYLRGPSLDGFEGLPAIRQARRAIGLSQALEEQQAKMAENGGKPSGVLSGVSNLSPESQARLRASWQERFGPGGSGGIAIMDGDTKFHPMTMTSVDAQYIETRRMQIEEIARAFRVQPIMLMQADKAATFASAEQMFRNHVIHTLGPWIARLEDAANRDILRRGSGDQPGLDRALRFDLDERNLLRGDFKDQAEYYAKALGAGGTPAWMTQNEVRAETGWNPVDDPDADQLSRGAMNIAPADQA